MNLNALKQGSHCLSKSCRILLIFINTIGALKLGPHLGKKRNPHPWRLRF